MKQTTAHDQNESLKAEVQSFWDAQACGESYAAGTELRTRLEAQARARYLLEPYIREFAGFEDAIGKDVLEVGVGMGADHHEWAKSKPRTLTGIDLTPAATRFTSQRIAFSGLKSNLCQGDAENLPFKDNSFDLVYSWGVLHHSPDTPRAINEVHRVLRAGGLARIMIYHKYGIVGYMLWIRYALLAGRPRRSLVDIYANHLESPGTKAYTIAESREMCSRFSRVNVRSLVSFGDLLQGNVGERRHRSLMLRIAKRLWPRWLIKSLFRNHGSQVLIEVIK
jgi:SAM-dependent methyltransferase